MLLFPALQNGESSFLVTYLHPGDYYITIVADANGDGFPGPGDITRAQHPITIQSEGQQQATTGSAGNESLAISVAIFPINLSLDFL